MASGRVGAVHRDDCRRLVGDARAADPDSLAEPPAVRAAAEKWDELHRRRPPRTWARYEQHRA
ncbi:hypothetical protein GCM10022416_35390 [Actinomadura keratinilytica]|uniref:Uncharacterized protein n=1 Tax=Actinomadura keratinilytica TaxID=547461 RepID=A0ABP7YZW8_9ACTN